MPIVNPMSEADYTPSRPTETLKRLEAARNTSSWLVWGGMVLALLWWGAAALGLIAFIGWSAIIAAEPMLIAAGTLALLIPGLMVIFSGFLAREQARSSAANAIVLEAAATLLTPAEQMGGEAQVFAQQMASASADVDRSMGHALSAMQAMATEIGDERQRLESVTYATSDNASELATRLGTERAALEQLTKDLREQTKVLGDAIPRQAAIIVESAKAAATEVESAETALEARLNTLEGTGRSLAQKIAAMDTLAAEAGKRNETLLFAIARMEEKLEQSRKTVETASRAGELAAAAAGTTGDRLMDAVRSALDGAKQASNEIQTRTLEASETAAKSLAELKDAGQQAAAAVRAAGMAARAEMDIAERRVSQTSSALYNKSQSVPRANGHASNGNGAAPITARPEPTEVRKSEPTPVTVPAASPSRAVDDDLFEASADRMAQAMLREAEADRDAPPRPADMPNLRDTLKVDTSNDVFDDDDDAIELTERVEAPALPVAQKSNGHSFSDIIADMEREERPTLSREDTAQSLIDSLEDSGIRLTDIFRPRDKKKIASAARKGDKQRRSTISNVTGRQVDRVRKRLRADRDLMTLARDFVALEEADALNALESTQGSSKNASARLAAFLLLDAALT